MIALMLTTTCGCMQGGAVYIGSGFTDFNQCKFTSNQAVR